MEELGTGHERPHIQLKLGVNGRKSRRGLQQSKIRTGILHLPRAHGQIPTNNFAVPGVIEFNRVVIIR